MRYSPRMNWLRIPVRWLGLLGLALAVHAQDASQFVAYPVGDTDLAAAEQVVRSVLTADDTVARDEKGKRLLIMASEARHLKVADIIAKLNPTARNIRIQVKFRGTSRREEREASVRGQGQVVLSPGGSSGTCAWPRSGSGDSLRRGLASMKLALMSFSTIDGSLMSPTTTTTARCGV